MENLHRLLRRGRYSELMDKLKALPERVLEREQGKTLAHTAVLHKSPEMLKDLLEIQPHLLNERDPSGATPLHFVAYARYENRAEVQNAGLAVVKLLVASGALVNARNNEGKTPLNTICNHVGFGWDGVMSWLIANGASVTTPDQWGNTPLHSLARDSDVMMPTSYYDLLLSNGADLLCKNDTGQTPLQLVKGACLENSGAQDLLRFLESWQESYLRGR